MKTRIALMFTGGFVAISIFGCAVDTDVNKKVNDDWHNHVAGPRPPPGAMKGPAGGPVGPFRNSGGVPPNATGPGQPTGEGSGPGKAPPGMASGSGGAKGGVAK
jgi:hypothetical protein